MVMILNPKSLLFTLNIVDRCEWYIHNKYLYTSFIHQMAFDISHKYHEMRTQCVLFHGSVHNGRFPKLI